MRRRLVWLLGQFFLLKFTRQAVYMLQVAEYDARPMLGWYWKARRAEYRGKLEYTLPAKLLLLFMRSGIVLQWSAVILLVLFMPQWWWLALIGALLAPGLWLHLMAVPLVLGRLLLIRPRQQRLIRESAAIFAAHPGIKIAVAGSYGKTTVKELLRTVLTEGKTVAATPANKNVAISHASFARSLTGKEDVVIIEFGEGAPGDIARFTQTVSPNLGIVTGLAPAHLDKYKTIDAVRDDMLSLLRAVGEGSVYVNGESRYWQPGDLVSGHVYTREGVGELRVEDVKVDLEGMSCLLHDGNVRLTIKTQLVGRHLLGVMAVVAAIARDLGLSQQQMEAGFAEAAAYDNRLQPRRLVSGAWLIADAYNGNIEGLRAGLELLKELPGRRKWYITPGLVDQGRETVGVHNELGRLIAAAQPDEVVLIRNSVADIILTAMKAHGFSGTVRLEDDPLEFYTSLEQLLAAGDIAMLQNDWPDNYR